MNDSLTTATENALAGVTANDHEVELRRPESSGNPSESPERPAPRRKKYFDHHLWGTYILLVIIAVIELFSASIQEVREGNIFMPVIRHGAFLLAGLVAMLVIQRMHYRHVYACIPLYVLFCIGMMIAVRVVGEDINGATRAIRIGGVPILPAEFMKLGAALGMAWILSQTQLKGKRDVTWMGLVWSLLFLFVCCGLLFTQGLSNTLVVLAIGFSMMLVGGMGWRKFGIALLVTAVIGGAALAIKTSVSDKNELSDREVLTLTLNHETVDAGRADGRGETWRNRVKRHFRGGKHLEPFSIENQQEQLSYIAQAHSGIIGVGPGRSRESARLPLAYSDYIFAIIVEELGLIAGLGILCVYMWILGRSAKLTVRFKHSMPGIMTIGCAFVIVFQALFHMAIVTGVFPVSGQPLPLISKGGISVIATSLAFGVMLSASRHATRYTDTSAEQKRERESLPANARADNPMLTGNV